MSQESTSAAVGPGQCSSEVDSEPRTSSAVSPHEGLVLLHSDAPATQSRLDPDTGDPTGMNASVASSCEGSLSPYGVQVLGNPYIQMLDDLVAKVEFEHVLNSVCGSRASSAPVQEHGTSYPEVESAAGTVSLTVEDHSIIDTVLDMEEEYNI
ncbi:hypothetical protein GN956_G5125 [Arapaima gigas]